MRVRTRHALLHATVRELKRRQRRLLGGRADDPTAGDRASSRGGSRRRARRWGWWWRRAPTAPRRGAVGGGGGESGSGAPANHAAGGPAEVLTYRPSFADDGDDETIDGEDSDADAASAPLRRFNYRGRGRDVAVPSARSATGAEAAATSGGAASGAATPSDDVDGLRRDFRIRRTRPLDRVAFSREINKYNVYIYILYICIYVYII